MCGPGLDGGSRDVDLAKGGSLTQACRAHTRGLPLTSWQPVMGVPSLVVAVGCMGGTYPLESSTAQFWGPLLLSEPQLPIYKLGMFPHRTV